MSLVNELLKKTANESRKFDFDFSDQVEIADENQTLTGTPTFSATPSGLTISQQAINAAGTKAQARIAGGAAGTTYHVTCLVTTSGGDTLEECGELRVIEC